MNKTVVINIVGLSSALLKHKELFLTQWIKKRNVSKIKPVLPAVTCAAQSTYLTGKWPNEHGIIANGWYFKEQSEVMLWKQSNHLVEAPKIWDVAKSKNAAFTSSNMFWWYNMYSNADYNVTPRPQYRADGQKKPDCYSKPGELRDQLQSKLGTFPLFHFWGPNTSIKATKWIADASKLVFEWHQPTLQLIYLPHLDYVLQKTNEEQTILKNLQELDVVFKDLVAFYEANNVEIIVLSEYGIAPVKAPFHINRLLRENNLLQIREENGLELLDAGESAAFAVSDHQIAHVYVKDKSKIDFLKKLLADCPEIDLVLDSKDQKKYHINHKRSGDLVVVAKQDYWFTYYYWLDDKKAPDFARNVDIHKKPGYDPVEMFTDPKKKMMTARIIFKILKKKLGFRSMLDIIPLDATLVKGSHGAVNIEEDYYPLIIQNIKNVSTQKDSFLQATDVFELILNQVFAKDSEV
ncbi:putative AlkP superfamily pyrophosphatase or phosphodiesterase [Wenyingzhuangia heitensis]|uniref:AlkP superfamily pyrophosphatase or phosphodiesterase n=1 Tax=Wenyingzhuangia heitensis TaxID=1487859 RepID=A0ABX0U9M1_9FLAO|nr:nucleotide pyrophosphatase/phosphodiesterase family protein [Wenyingzhuangia heitensis]NIJ45532.1 putative AlkP superfamily pyrophosphatase or phosphodiesterase [Wenyingzhuangia heitensis]